MTPDQAAPGDTITVSGEGFPVSSNRGAQALVEVTYDYGLARSTATVSVDAGGQFSTEITVPRGVQIPLHQPGDGHL